MENNLYKLEDINKLINAGETLILAGDEKLLQRVDKGQWIAGTIPYFMTSAGGQRSQQEIFATILPRNIITNVEIKNYNTNNLSSFTSDYPKHGVTFIIVPSGSEVHQTFAKNVSNYQNVFNTPLVGWVSGIDLADLGKEKAKVFNGTNLSVTDSEATLMHVELSSDYYTQVEIVNIFSQGNGDEIKFLEPGFQVQDCLINGKKTNFAAYLKENHINTEFPLVANYGGAKINVSFQAINDDQGVSFYAPVFPEVTYQLAKPISDYEAAFKRQLSAMKSSPIFSCNCILNYLYAKLESKKIGPATGPITFGEIAYMLLNQTLVYLDFKKKRE